VVLTRPAAPLTPGLRSLLLRRLPLQRSAQERTLAGFPRMRLPVYGPISLAVSPRLLFSVTAFAYWQHYAAKAFLCQVIGAAKAFLCQA
jgi:hypothetical protein